MSAFKGNECSICLFKRSNKNEPNFFRTIAMLAIRRLIQCQILSLLISKSMHMETLSRLIDITKASTPCFPQTGQAQPIVIFLTQAPLLPEKTKSATTRCWRRQTERSANKKK